MNNKLTYIASGPNYLRLNYLEKYGNLVLNDWINNSFNKMQNNPNHTFGLLYNAWTESKLGPLIKENFRSNLETIQSDSGGLQVVTRGKTITDEFKKKVYLNQGKYSQMAMSFDEIPVSLTSKKSIRGDTRNKYFDHDKVEHCARLTGKNVFEQIKTFLDMKSETKPIFIVQGNDYDSYMKWMEYSFKEIPSEYRQYISGIAMASTSLGQGPLEDIKKAFYYTCLPEHGTNHIHMLGVGSFPRMIPNLIFLQNGLYNESYLTYDSTSHVSSSVYGRYFLDGRWLNFERHFDRKIYQTILDDVTKLFDLESCTVEHFHEVINMPGIKYKNKFGSMNLSIKVQMAIILKTIKNFMNYVDECISSKTNLLNSSNDNIYNHLYEVKTMSDFNHWMKNFSNHVLSQPIPNTRPANLSGLFS